MSYILLSGAPQDSGISLQTVLELGPTVPLFGVCMGLQCIGEAFGGESNRYECYDSHLFCISNLTGLLICFMSTKL